MLYTCVYLRDVWKTHEFKLAIPENRCKHSREYENEQRERPRLLGFSPLSYNLKLREHG